MIRDVGAAVTPLPGRTFLPEVINLVRNCHDYLEIVLYEWKWEPHQRQSELQHLSNEVLMASRRGVKVRVLLNKEEAKHHLTSINGLTMRFLGEAGVECKFGPSFPATHAKMWLIDRKITVLGSHNLSKKAVFNNDEASVIIKSVPATMEFLRYFDLLWHRF
jgi:phosphatidylserine/phosphatidylglycerophosphate/cardiolipin synthase-like enzyme